MLVERFDALELAKGSGCCWPSASTRPRGGGGSALCWRGLFAWVTAFFATVCVLQLALYTGCAAKLGRNNHYAFPDGPGCLLDVASLGERAAVLGFPRLGLPLLLGGLATGTVLVATLLRHVAVGARDEAA